MNKKLVYIGVGHGGKDSGAIGGGMKEKDLCLDIAMNCKQYLLQHYDVNVVISRMSDKFVSINTKIWQCNRVNADIGIDVHVNAGGGIGAEFYHSKFSNSGKRLASLLWNEVKKMGQINHGDPIKTKLNKNGMDYYAMIRKTECPFVICECAFIDSEIDAKKLKSENWIEDIGKAYAIAIANYLNLKSSAVSSDKPLYKVQIGAYSNYNNAVEMVNKAKNLGFDAYVVKTSELKG